MPRSLVLLLPLLLAANACATHRISVTLDRGTKWGDDVPTAPASAKRRTTP